MLITPCQMLFVDLCDFVDLCGLPLRPCNGILSIMRELAVSAGLTEQQRVLVHLVVHNGKGTQEAGELAGYKSNSVYSALKRPAVAAAITEAIQLDLAAV